MCRMRLLCRVGEEEDKRLMIPEPWALVGSRIGCLCRTGVLVFIGRLACSVSSTSRGVGMTSCSGTILTHTNSLGLQLAPFAHNIYE